jgi:hypothetical protein
LSLTPKSRLAGYKSDLSDNSACKTAWQFPRELCLSLFAEHKSSKMLNPFVFAACTRAEASPLRLEML